MKKNKKVLLYDPYIDSLGGGEKHILSIVEVLAKRGYQIDIAWNDEEILPKIKKRFPHIDISLSCVHGFKEMTSLSRMLLTRDYEYLFYVTDGSYFASLAPHNYIFAMVPKKEMYFQNAITKLKLFNYEFITNSGFTKKFVDEWTGKLSHLVYPYIDENYFENKNIKKEKIILSVGRFFKHLHTKRQDVAIKAFKELKKMDDHFLTYNLILAGGLQDSDKEYFNELLEMKGSDNSIQLLPNVSYKELSDLYKKAAYYWHCAGYEVDQNIDPDRVEHLGIAPLEAMANSCVTLCYDAGGMKEVINSGSNGFLYSSIGELVSSTMECEANQEEKKRVTQNARNDVKKTFSKDHFIKTVSDLLHI